MPIIAPATPGSIPQKNPQLFALAQQLESQFLAEMLKVSGVGTPRETFGGGEGEAQFSSFLVQEYASAITARGGLGLSEHIYNSLVAREGTP